VGDSGLEILHGGVGRDVEQGARTSKHILVFAIDPISLNSLFTLCKFHFIHSKASSISRLISFILLALFHIACVALHNSYCYILCMLGLLVCVHHLYSSNKSFTKHLNPFQGESRGVSPEPCKGNSATLVELY